MGFFSDLFKGKKSKIDVQGAVSNLSPVQQDIERSLGEFLLSRVGQGLPSFPGDLVAQPSGQESAGLDALTQFLATSEETSQGNQGALDTLTRLFTDEIDPDRAVELFQQGIRGPATRRFQEETLPLIRESFIGPGNLFSTARAESERRAFRDLQDRLGSQEVDFQLGLRESDLDRALKASSVFPEIQRGVSEAPLRRARAGLELGGLERQIAQLELDKELEEFIRTTPELNPILGQALQFLGIDSQTPLVVRRPATTGVFGAGGNFDVATTIDNVGKIFDIVSGGDDKKKKAATAAASAGGA